MLSPVPLWKPGSTSRCALGLALLGALATLGRPAFAAADPPPFAWGDYLGASGSDYANGVAVDSAGNIIVVGQTASSGWISGGLAPSYHGGIDAFVMKMTAAGEHLWSTYLGGAGEDWANAVAVNADDEIVVVGYTASGNWTSGGADTTYNGNGDGFIVKLDAAGALVWSTYAGGNQADDIFAVTVDGDGYVIVAGDTQSDSWMSGSGETSRQGGRDGFAARYSASGVRQWAAYIGGTDADAAYGVATDDSGNVYVAGTTASSLWTAGGFDSSYGGNVDGFLAKLNWNGTQAWSAYLGGTAEDWAIGVSAGTDGVIFVTGYTLSSGWVDSDGDGDPGTSADVAYGGGGDAFVAKVSSGAELLWSTYLGGTGHEHGKAVSAGPGNTVYVTGGTESAAWATGGHDTTYGGTRDAFVAKLSSAGATNWSCYLGGSNSDAGNALARDADGNVMVAGDTQSSGWITGGFDITLNGIDGFVVRLGDGAPSAPSGTFLATVGSTQVEAGCGLWDFSGPHTLAVGDGALTMDWTHDTKGKLSGPSAVFSPPGTQASKGYTIPMTLKGSVKGSKGKVTVKMNVKGKRVGTPDDPAAKASAAVSMTLTLDLATRQLRGPWKASWKLGKTKFSDSGECVFDLADGMDGTYALQFDLVGAGTAITGGAELRLSNGTAYSFVTKGTYGGGICAVTLTGSPGDPAAKAIKISASLKTHDDGTATINGFTGKALGQAVTW